MTTYEIMCVFAPQDELFTEGLGAVKKVLSTLNASIEKEEDMGVRKIAGLIQKHTHAHYLYFIAKLNPQDAHSIRKEVALITPLLRILVIKKEPVTKKERAIKRERMSKKELDIKPDIKQDIKPDIKPGGERNYV